MEFMISYRTFAFSMNCGNQTFADEKSAREYIAANQANWKSWTLFSYNPVPVGAYDPFAGVLTEIDYHIVDDQI